MPAYTISSVSESSTIFLLPAVGICIGYAISLRPVVLVPAAGPSRVLSSIIIIGSVPLVAEPVVVNAVVTTFPLGGDKGYRPFLRILTGSSVWNSFVPLSWTVQNGTSSSYCLHHLEMLGLCRIGVPSQLRMYPFVNRRVGVSLVPLNNLSLSS